MTDRGSGAEGRDEPGIVLQFPGARDGKRHRLEQPVTFDRRELDAILRLYGRMVAAGEWRDYAIDHLKERAVFSVFRRTSEHPLYQITKTPSLARKQGAYAVTGMNGQVLKRGQDLPRVLAVFDKALKLVGA